jgi:uncharacterized protein YuzE
MLVTYDADADAVYVYLRDVNHEVDDTRAIDGDRNVDYLGDVPLGIEFLNASRGLRLEGLPEKEAVAALLRDEANTAHLAVRFLDNDVDESAPLASPVALTVTKRVVNRVG